MAELINLRQARKAKARHAADVKSGEQRLLHGRTKLEKRAEKARIEAAERHLDGHRRDEPGE